MFSSQSIPNPYGVTVFGSSVIRVEPDVVEVEFSVSRVDPKTDKAFALAHDAVTKIQSYLRTINDIDVSVSQITLRPHTVYRNGEHEFVGYRSSVGFSVILRDLRRLEELLKGIIEAGANNIGSIDFQTTRLKALRAQARTQAIQAAIEKAEVYCAAANKILGEIIHIEDVNPDSLRRREGHTQTEIPTDAGDELRPFSSDSIAVNGAVRVAFEFEDT